jgi:DNA-binding MarR family transcriptional regulator
MANRELFLQAHVTDQLVGRIVEERLREVGIPGYLLSLLTHVRDHAPVSPSRVCEASGVPLTTLRDNVQRLVERGLVRRVPHPHDGRSYLLVATDRGREVAEAAGQALHAAYEALEQRLPRGLARSERALRELNDALRDVLAALEEEATLSSGTEVGARVSGGVSRGA